MDYRNYWRSYRMGKWYLLGLKKQMSDPVTITKLGTNASILRVHEDANKIPGKWTFSCIVEIDGETCKIHAADRAPNAKELISIREHLIARGVSKVEWDRAKNGRLERRQFSR